MTTPTDPRLSETVNGGELIRYEYDRHSCRTPGWWKRFRHGIYILDRWVCGECKKAWRFDWTGGPSSMAKGWRPL